MSERHKTHNGRDVDGRFRVRQADVDDLVESPNGPEYLRDDVRMGGAVEDTGMRAGQHGQHISELIDENRQDVDHAVGRDESKAERRSARRHKGNR